MQRRDGLKARQTKAQKHRGRKNSASAIKTCVGW